MEANYSSLSEANKDYEGCKKIALECNDYFFSNGSIKGKWSEIDKEQFYAEIEGFEMSDFGKSKTSCLQCYLMKAEANILLYMKLKMTKKDVKKLHWNVRKN